MFFCTNCSAGFENAQQLTLHRQLYCSAGNLVTGIRLQPNNATAGFPNSGINLNGGVDIMQNALTASLLGAQYHHHHNNNNSHNNNNNNPLNMYNSAAGIGSNFGFGGGNFMDRQVLERQLGAMILDKAGISSIPAREMYMQDQMMMLALNTTRLQHEEVMRAQMEAERLRRELYGGQHPTGASSSLRAITENKNNNTTGEAPVKIISTKEAENNKKKETSPTRLPISASSVLQARTYTLVLERLEGVDIQVPLVDLIMVVEEYHLLEGLEQWLLESLGRKEYRHVDIKREDITSFVIALKQPIEFTLKQESDLHVFIFTFMFRGKPLFWASISARQEGMWMSVLRRTPVDVSTSLQMTDHCLRDTMIRGTIEGDYSEDVLTEAERYLKNGVVILSQPPGNSKPAPEKVITPPQTHLRTPPRTHLRTPPQTHLRTPPRTPPPKNEPVPLDKDAVEKLLWKLDFDNNGSVIVPKNYKISKNTKIDFSDMDKNSQADPSVLFGLRSDQDIFPPQEPPGHGPYMNQIDLNISSVCTLPLNTAYSRVLVYLLNYIDQETGQVMNDHKDPAALLRYPNVIKYHNVNDNPISPTFDVQMGGVMIGDNTFIIAIIEYITDKGEGPYVFGHVGLPIHSKSFRGNFISRVKLGDPRRPLSRQINELMSLNEERQNMKKYSQLQIEETFDSETLYKNILHPPEIRAECCPCSYIMWSLDYDTNAPYFDFPKQPKLSEGEVLLFNSRQALNNNTEPFFDTLESAMKEFDGDVALMGNKIHSIIPYNPGRGYFLSIEELHGLGRDRAFYTVVIDTGSDAPNGIMQSLNRDLSSDVAAPFFKDPMRTITGVANSPYEVALFYLIKVTNIDSIKEHGDKKLKVDTVAWSMLRIFFDDGTLRHGRITLPWFNDVPPEELLDQLESDPLDKVFTTWFGSKKITHLEPYATVIVSIGDPIDAGQIIVNHPGRPLPQLLLVPSSKKSLFPYIGYEGAVGYSQKQLAESIAGVTLEQIQTALQAGIMKYVDENFGR